jgi:hypothetical protein
MFLFSRCALLGFWLVSFYSISQVAKESNVDIKKEREEVCGYWFCGSSTQGNNGGGKEPPIKNE